MGEKNTRLLTTSGICSCSIIWQKLTCLGPRLNAYGANKRVRQRVCKSTGMAGLWMVEEKQPEVRLLYLTLLSVKIKSADVVKHQRPRF